MIMEEWFKLYTTASLPEASIIKGMLEENNITTILVNKLDSSYLSFGEIEIFVPVFYKQLAATLLANTLAN